MIWWVVAAGVIILWAVAAYNGLVQLRVRADGAWSDIQVQLKRRHDLIPNVVETVKGYAAHEQQLFIRVAEARSRAMDAAGPTDKAVAEGRLTESLRTLFAVAERYPELRANEQFMGLQQALTKIEEALQGARRYYNAVVRDYNTKGAMVPDAIIARLAGFAPKEFFQLDSPAEAAVPPVSFQPKT
jgi:LemA protein